MSKVKGNVIDPLDVVYGATLEDLIKKAEEGLAPPSAIENIKKSFPHGIPQAGADALRFTLAALAAQGRNIRLSLSRVEGYRNFANKLWNAARFALMNMTGYDADRFGDALRGENESARLAVADKWILSRLQRTAHEVDEALEAYRFNDAAQALYKFIWSDLCDWYIEMAKPVLYDDRNEVSVQQRKRAVQGCLATSLETACRLLHPFMPFITEEIWQQLPKPVGTPGSIMITMYPVADQALIDEAAERTVGTLQEVVTAIRNLRAEYNVPPSAQVDVTVRAGGDELEATLEAEAVLLRTLGRIGKLTITGPGEAPAGSVVSVVGDAEVCLHVAGTIDVAAETARIDRDLKKTEKERAQVEGRLGNANFVSRAPAEVVEEVRARLAELIDKSHRLKQSLDRLSRL
jgi:valyl-tRNA synthetase